MNIGQYLRAPAILLAGLILPLLALSAEAAGWKATGEIAAPEAVQAAAADGQFVYAISSTAIAKYDRRTGERVATSTGEAHHLNSGFFWEGRLYCAHSNYPRQPEQSEILVLDPHTMRLSSFKDFGNFGGSLTWVVRRDGHWWCNFARYGEHNAETFLVKFDDHWQEQGRWTYPPEVVRQLGRYSISGGLWDGDSLLVTGHDDRVLFRVRPPSTGEVLEFIEQLPAPFTGQGIAADPQTGGLVGINRGQRRIVFAAFAGDQAETQQPARLRVLCYNIHHGEGVDGKLDLEHIARVIRSVEPDVVALQEVDKNTQRTGKVDQPAELARLTGMQAAFGGNLAFQGGEYGNAVLSRWPITRRKNHLLPSFDRGEQRGVLEVEIAWPQAPQPLVFFATHLDHRSNDQERRESAKFINNLAAALGDRPALLAGDLNDTPDSSALKLFEQVWTRANREPLPTIPVGQPKRQIDFILFRPANRWNVVEVKVLPEATASDHRPIFAVLEQTPSSATSADDPSR